MDSLLQRPVILVGRLFEVPSTVLLRTDGYKSENRSMAYALERVVHIPQPDDPGYRTFNSMSWNTCDTSG